MTITKVWWDESLGMYDDSEKGDTCFHVKSKRVLFTNFRNRKMMLKANWYEKCEKSLLSHCKENPYRHKHKREVSFMHALFSSTAADHLKPYGHEIMTIMYHGYGCITRTDFGVASSFLSHLASPRCFYSGMTSFFRDG